MNICSSPRRHPLSKLVLFKHLLSKFVEFLRQMEQTKVLFDLFPFTIWDGAYGKCLGKEQVCSKT